MHHALPLIVLASIAQTLCGAVVEPRDQDGKVIAPITTIVNQQPNYSVPVLKPLTLDEAERYDSYVDIVPIKEREPGVDVNTVSRRNAGSILHSYSIVFLGGNPFMVATFLRPKSIPSDTSEAPPPRKDKR